MKPDRVVIGAASPQAFKIMRELYEPFVRTGAPILEMDNPSAEMTKYAANALLATRISFMNEIANLCELVGADVDFVRRGVGHDRRLGHHFLFPGVGYGGSCFPKDVQAVIHTAHENGMKFPLLNAVEEVNDAQKRRLVDKVVAEFGERLAGRRFAVWGLAFKPKTDDMREAPSITVINGLLERGAAVAVHDPEALAVAHRFFGDRVTYHRVNYEAPTVRTLLIVTDWNEFRRPDFTRMKQPLKRPLISTAATRTIPMSCGSMVFTYFYPRAYARADLASGGQRVASADHRRCRVHRLASRERFLADGADVICMDNFLTGTPDNIAHLLEPALHVHPAGRDHLHLREGSGGRDLVLARRRRAPSTISSRPSRR